MIILKTPKGWTGPKEVDGLKTEGFWRSHQVPLAEIATKPDHVRLLEQWMKSYRPGGAVRRERRAAAGNRALAPAGERRMSANPHANGGTGAFDLHLPDIADYAVKIDKPGERDAEATSVMGGFLRDVLHGNEANGISACSAPTRRLPTGSRACSRSQTGRGTRRRFPMTITWRRTAG